MHCYDYSPDYEDEGEIPIHLKNAIPAKPNMRVSGYSWSCYSRQENENGEPTDQDEQGANTVGAAFKRMSWRQSNAILHNRYPCVPLLPVNQEPNELPEWNTFRDMADGGTVNCTGGGEGDLT